MRAGASVCAAAAGAVAREAEGGPGAGDEAGRARSGVLGANWTPVLRVTGSCSTTDLGGGLGLRRWAVSLHVVRTSRRTGAVG